jgi:hypothetical protein
MSSRRCSVQAVRPSFAVLAVLLLSGCSSIGDFGRLQDPLRTDDIHAWVGQEAAASAGAPISQYNLTEEERTLRDLAFPLIEPPYDRVRWDAVVIEYGIQRQFRRDLWVYDVAAYYAHLTGPFHRSSVARYNKLIDDMRNDIVRIEPFIEAARRVVELDKHRENSMQYLSTVSPLEKDQGLARIGENSLTIAWVEHSLLDRCASYRFALEHLVVAEPEPAAAEAERVLMQLQQMIKGTQLVGPPVIAGRPVAVKEASVKPQMTTGSVRAGTVHQRSPAAPSASIQAPAPARAIE